MPFWGGKITEGDYSDSREWGSGPSMPIAPAVRRTSVRGKVGQLDEPHPLTPGDKATTAGRHLLRACRTEQRALIRRPGHHQTGRRQLAQPLDHRFVERAAGATGPPRDHQMQADIAGL